MKRIVSIVAIAGLMFGAVSVAEAGKKKAKPVKTSLYFHGTEAVGEGDLANYFQGAGYMKMDSSKPASGAPKSRQFTTWTGDPQMWNDCAGSALLPVWQGSVSGRIVGDMKVTLNAVATPTKEVTVQVWPDLMSQTCASNDLGEGEYPVPAAEATATLNPAGETVITLKKVNFKAIAALTLQVLPHGPTPGRVLYDSAEFASGVSFSCIPARGKTCAP